MRFSEVFLSFSSQFVTATMMLSMGREEWTKLISLILSIHIDHYWLLEVRHKK